MPAKKITQDAKVTYIRAMITTDAKWTERAVLALYARQTADEQSAKVTSHHNQMGFSGVDAEWMSSMAEWIGKSRRAEGSRLSPKQLQITQRKIGKYARQLLTIIEERGEAAIAKLHLQVAQAQAEERAREVETAAASHNGTVYGPRWSMTADTEDQGEYAPADLPEWDTIEAEAGDCPEWDAIRSAADYGVRSKPKGKQGKWAVVNHNGAPVRLVGVSRAG